MTVSVIILALCLAAACVRNRQLRRRIAALQAESARALEDDGLMAQLETAEAAGSEMASRLLEAGRAIHLALPPVRTRCFPTLDGQAREQYDAKMLSCSDYKERRKVNRRWHENGYQFPIEMRVGIIRNCIDKKGRDLYRKIFDEQDRRKATFSPTATP